MQNKLSIVQVIDMLNTGGAERVLVNLSNLLHVNGHTVKVVTTVKPGPLAAQLQAGIALQSLNRGWKWNPLTMYKLIQAVKDFDVIHVHSRHNLRYLLLAKTLFGLKKEIFYHEHHGNRINTKATQLEKKLFASINFIAVSERLKQWAINEAGVDASNTFVLPNIVLKEEVKDAKKNEVRISLVMVSNFVPVKNIEFAITVFSKLHAQSKKFHLTIIGTVADKNYYSKIVSLIDEKGLQQYVTIISDCTNAQQLLPQFDLAIHTSTSESGPLVLIEYMAQLLPFVTYRTGKVVEQIAKELPEFIMQCFNADEWVLHINVLLQKDRQQLHQQLENIFEKYYSAKAYYNQCISIYAQGLGK